VSKRRYTLSATVPLAPSDAYDTPAEAVAPLLSRLPRRQRFVEPCAGKGALVEALEAAGHRCVGKWDVAPRATGIIQRDGSELGQERSDFAIITNPPFSRRSRGTLDRLLGAWLESGAPVWLLLPLDFTAAQVSAPAMGSCTGIAIIGRVRWFGGTNSTDNFAWFRFQRGRPGGALRFWPQDRKR
jgi:hypothetical protein